MIYSFNGIIPIVDPSSFIHPQASVTGNVTIGARCYIGPGAAIRGDFGKIIIEDGCNVQENCTLHSFPGEICWLKQNAHIGHGAIIHGATIGYNCLIGINAVVMDNVILNDECIVGAMSFIKADSIFEKRSLIVGNPAKKIKDISDEMISWKNEGTKIYQQLAEDMLTKFKVVERALLPNSPEAIAQQNKTSIYEYKTWNQTKEND